MNTILGIDPSLETGLAVVRMDARPKFLAGTCIKPGTKIRGMDRIDFIVNAAQDWAHRQWQQHRWQTVAIELPAVGRLNASPLQWRLIGRLEQVFHDPQNPILTVTPGKAKQAVGLPYHSPEKPVHAVEVLLGMDTPIADTKYAREAVSDAVAIAIAAHRLNQEDVA